MYTLFEHQKEAVSAMSKLREEGRGVILADEMGCGKTLSMIETLRQNVFAPHCSPDGRVLVVVPLSLLPQWYEEVGKVLPDIKVQIFHGTGREMDDESRVVVTTYDIVARSHQKSGMSSPLHSVEWDSVVLDEAHYIRNLVKSKKGFGKTESASIAGKAVINLTKKFGYAMTGTPWCNDVTDLYSLLDFLGENRSKSGNYDGDWIIRRTKKETLTLPLCTEEVSFVKATPEIENLRKKYLKMGSYATDDYKHGDLKERAKATMMIITCALRIRQASDSPFMTPDVKLEDKHGAYSIMKRSPKIERAREFVLEQLEKKQKTVIFSKFVSCIKLLEKAISPLCDTELFIGSMNKTQRGDAIERFMGDPSCDVLLISIDCGGVGLNLTCATMAIIMEPWYNPFVELQAQNRIDRIGQKQETRIIRIVDDSEKSADTWIRGIQQKKADSAASTIRGLDGMTLSYKKGGDFTMKDFLSLFRKVKEYIPREIENGFDIYTSGEDSLTDRETLFRNTTPRVKSEWYEEEEEEEDEDSIPISVLLAREKMRLSS